MTVQPLDPATRQVMMTLAAIAATGATPRPSGESRLEHTERIKNGITFQLADTSLATGGTWQLVWHALSPDNANLAYIAWDGANNLAVVIRGTVAGNATDLLEDLDVGTVVPFTPFTAGDRQQLVAVSKGAMDGFTQIVAMRSDGDTLVEALTTLFRQLPNATVYVVGHSLGGCLATMVAPYLRAQNWTVGTPAFALSTFAAPTAGDQNFADFVNGVEWTANEHCYNAYDLIPQAWAGLDATKNWYPSPGPQANFDVKALISTIASLTGPNAYVQPGYQYAINTDYGKHGSYDQNATRASVEDFMDQVAFQHANSLYLAQLGAHAVTSGPQVTSISPASGEAGTQITINGSGFTTNPPAGETLVDFGTVPCEKLSVSTDGTQITCVVPEGTGVVDVRVTNILGTSPVALFAQFAYDGPEPALVYDISPASGVLETKVTINGWAFATDPVVYFGNKPARLQSTSPTQIVAFAPLPDQSPTAPSTVNVRVLTNGYLTPTAVSNEFTYTGL